MTALNTATPHEPSRQDEFREIVELSGDMLELAREGEWDAVADIQEHRKRLVHAFFEHKPSRDEAGFIRSGIERILTLDKQTMALGDEAKNGFTEKLATLSTNRRATHAYLDNQ